MTPFRYFRDPLFLTACAFYGLNRWIFKSWTTAPFIHGHFNDILLIPCALPPILWVQSQLGIRKKEDAPTTGEIVFHLAIWSILFEVAGPFVFRVTGDIFDIAAYAAGAVFSGLWWHCAYRRG